MQKEFVKISKQKIKLELDTAHVLTAPVLAWQAALKNTIEELNLLNDIDVILMVEKCIRGEIHDAIYWYAKANNKYMKDYNKNKEPLYLSLILGYKHFVWLSKVTKAAYERL